MIAGYNSIDYQDSCNHAFKVKQTKKQQRIRKNIPNSMSIRPSTSGGVGRITPIHVPIDPANIYSAATRNGIARAVS